MNKEKRTAMEVKITKIINVQYGTIIQGVIIENNVEIAEFTIKKFDEGSKYGIMVAE